MAASPPRDPTPTAISTSTSPATAPTGARRATWRPSSRSSPTWPRSSPACGPPWGPAHHPDVQDHAGRDPGGPAMTVLVTGGSKGIGLAIAKRLAPRHGRVVLAYHSDDAAAEHAVAEIAGAGGEAVAIKGDVGTLEGSAALIAEVARQGHGLTHIVHSAAMIYPT